MPEYTQTERPLRVFSKLGDDVLLLGGFNGFEAVSQPFSFQLDLLSTRADIDPAEVMRTPMRVEVSVADTDIRHIHGVVSRFAQLGKRDELTFYRAEIVPWLWFLTLSRESRIYQELTVPDILEQVFKRAGYSDFELRLTRSYGQRLFCVQYRETHFAFVSRLMEEEGIFYFFEHTDEKHLLVLTDDSSGSSPVVGPEGIRFSPEGYTDEYMVSELEREQRVHAGRITLWEYDFEKPNVELHESQGENDEEVYDYPGKYREPDDGDRLARLLLEAEEVEREVVRGVSKASGLIPGCHFSLEEHFHKTTNAKYYVTQVRHLAMAGEFRAWEGGAALDYRNDFLAIPHVTPYRPSRHTPRPMIHGSQSALVVGPPGEEVHTDKHARVKVHFYWDRDSKKDEKSSCWIRVTTPWGGKGYGGVSIPRIGNEVIVAFEEGDPDRPIIIGSVYNADQAPPFSLPGAGIQMGMKSRSSPGGGGNNEITMTDTKGKEMMNIHAQYDQVTTVEHDDTQHIKNDRTITVDGKHTETIDKDTTIKIVTGNLSETVAAGTQTTTVNKDLKIKSESALIHVTAATEIKLEVGASSLLMKADGTINLKGVNVSIKGVAVAINADTTAEVHGLTVMVKGDTMASIEAPQVMSEGKATNIVKGGMVMLNP